MTEPSADCPHGQLDQLPVPTQASPQGPLSKMDPTAACASSRAGESGREMALRSLEEACAAGDDRRTAALLLQLRQQLSEQLSSRRPCSSLEHSRSLWSTAVTVLRSSPCVEVRVKACQLLEVLGQRCNTCSGEEDGKGVVWEDAPGAVIALLSQGRKDLVLLPAAIRALLSFSGCLNCRSFYDRASQDALGKQGAVEALVGALSWLEEVATVQAPEMITSQPAKHAIADGMQALHFLSLMNRRNVAALAASRGLGIIRACMKDKCNELTVQEHSCMILAELACRPGASDQEIIECVAAVTNVARLQMREKFIEVARAAVWSLTRIASCVLHPCNYQQQHDGYFRGLLEVWSIMQGQALQMIMDMMHSCQHKDDPLMKHCLDFIAVVGGEGKGFKGVQTPSLESSPLSDAAQIVYNQAFLGAQDTRIQAAALRTLYALLGDLQCCPGGLIGQGAIDSILKTMRNSRRWRETPDKDVFCIEVFGMGILFKLLGWLDMSKSGEKHLGANSIGPNDLMSYVLDIHAAVAYITHHIEESAEKLNVVMKSINAMEPVVEGRDVLLAIEAAVVFLQFCGEDAINSTDRDGLTILHRLAQSGLTECLKVFIEAAGGRIDYLKRTKFGLNALQLARSSKNPGCIAILEKVTEAAADAAQDALLQELAREDDSKQSKHQSPQGKKSRKKRITQAESGEKKPVDRVTEKMKEEESNRRRQETEIMKRRIDEAYEWAIEERRRQLREQEKQKTRDEEGLSQLQEKKVSPEPKIALRSTVNQRLECSHCDLNDEQNLLECSLQKTTLLISQGCSSSTLCDGSLGISPDSNSSSTPTRDCPGPGRSSHGLLCDTPGAMMLGIGAANYPDAVSKDGFGCNSMNGIQSPQADSHSQVSLTLTVPTSSAGDGVTNSQISSMKHEGHRSMESGRQLFLFDDGKLCPGASYEMLGQHSPKNGLVSGPLTSSMDSVSIWSTPTAANRHKSCGEQSWQSMFTDNQVSTLEQAPHNDWRSLGKGSPPAAGGSCPMDSIYTPNTEHIQTPTSSSRVTPPHSSCIDSAAMKRSLWYTYPQAKKVRNEGEACEFRSQEMSAAHKAHALNFGSQSCILEHKQLETSQSWNGINGSEHSSNVQNSQILTTSQPEADEEVDDHQILHWLPSEISGLIDSNLDKLEDPSLGPAVCTPLRAPVPATPDIPTRTISSLSVPTPHSFGRERNVWSRSGLDYWDNSGSPLTGDACQTDGPGVESSLGMRHFPSPIRPVQVWQKAMSRSSDARLTSSGPNSTQWDVMPAAAVAFHMVEDNKGPSKHLWLGNLNTRLPRSVLKSVFEAYGPVEDVVTFPGRMYAFVNFVNCEDAQRAAQDLDMKEVPALTGSRKLVIKFRPNRKALGRVGGDLMPGVHSSDGSNVTCPTAAQMTVPFPSWEAPPPEEGSPQPRLHTMDKVQQPANIDTGVQNWPEPEEEFQAYEPEGCSSGDDPSQPPEGNPSRHLWLGNVCLRPSKTVLFSLFSRYGPVESVRIFPGKTFAFVNFQQSQHAACAKEALDGEVVSAISATKSLVVRFQREGSGPPSWFKVNRRRGVRSEKSPGSDKGVRDEEWTPGQERVVTSAIEQSQWCVGSFGDDRDGPKNGTFQKNEQSGTTLANRLNPNNAHYDSQLAARYKTMGRGDKEVLWTDVQPGLGDEYSPSDILTPLRSSTALEADSIGRLTRTLSAAVRGSILGDFPEGGGWTQGSQPMFNQSFGDHSLYGANGMSPPAPVEHSQMHSTVRRHQHTPSMPNLSSVHPCTRDMSSHSCHSGLEVPRLSLQDSHFGRSEQGFTERSPQAMTGSLGQFPNRLPTSNPVMIGLMHGSHNRGYSTGAMPGEVGFGVPLGSGNSIGVHDMMLHGSMSLDCASGAFNKKSIW